LTKDGNQLFFFEKRTEIDKGCQTFGAIQAPNVFLLILVATFKVGEVTGVTVE
jgi:hypothetical protein